MAPRPNRDASLLNLYHVLISGNNNEDIFLDDEDKLQFLNILNDKIENDECSIYAFCILCNKANFIISPLKYSLSDIMKQINVSYASYYNKKYERTGHVFHDRFRSAAINSSSQFKTICRYIRYIPVIEGEALNPEEYRFSSSRHSDNQYSLEHISGYYDKCFSNLEQIARHLIESYLDENKLTFQSIQSKSCCEHKTRLVMLVRNSTGYSIRKISQLLNINRGEVYRIIQISKEEADE